MALLKLPAGSRLALLDLNPTVLEKTCSSKPSVICVVGDALRLLFIDAAFTRLLMLASSTISQAMSVGGWL